MTQTTASQPSVFSEVLPSPNENRFIRLAFHAPKMMWRMGFGPVMGKIILILSQTGRKSGKARHTPLEYHTYQGQIYVVNAYGKHSAWSKNLRADPRATLQMADGVHSMRAHFLETAEEYDHAYGLYENDAFVRAFLNMFGIHPTREEFINMRERFEMITFYPTDEPTPAPLEVDLKWVPPLALGALLLGYVIGKLED